MPTLIKFDSNWADEMDVSGFRITQDSKEKVIEKLKISYMERTLDDLIEDLDITEEDLQKYKKACQNYKLSPEITISEKDVKKLLSGSITIGIGTNEELEYEDFDQYLDECEITEISNEEYQTIKKLFGEKYGHSLDIGGYSYSNIIIKIRE